MMLFCDPEQKPLLAELLCRYELNINYLDNTASIPGSWFGEPEAGLIKNQLYVRPDTPVHSALHESCHYICMDSQRREQLHTDAAGGYDEENAVCYLQILLADFLPGFGRAGMMHDMDDWGYTFRLGSAKRWFYEDAEDARQWLLNHQLIDTNDHPTWKLRQ